MDRQCHVPYWTSYEEELVRQAILLEDKKEREERRADGMIYEFDDNPVFKKLIDESGAEYWRVLDIFDRLKNNRF